ncbi:methylated-DNA--[protein]-cysteine S-methyltransferase [Nostocoides sp. HKS02]|uniref:methylated-DNA--[protein]-cysteine S-methyltransferase n=1 Tax=Nostocoides sp. HKS02 TaxID=1813880 RepID=UPI0012B4AB75|nr:methylated-DNA--[protein]-cysteine S-methyltransferase [Tetrasphaera sp. HKS02]QGN58598.1 methylated-DNA--[protein]-cysteine S-methyltransferase [Tetrasphaera sp. HKS02]
MTDPAALLRSYSPPAHPPVLEPSDVSYVVEDTAIGRMLLARNASGALVASSFVPDAAAEDHVLARLSARVSPRVLRQPRELDEVRAQLDAFLAGRSHTFSVRTDLALASDFQRAVLPRLAASIGYGERATYGQLAKLVERPSAARAVGAALGANPLCVVIPCHRVVASSGALTGYAGGLAAKRYLLDLESGGSSRD